MLVGSATSLGPFERHHSARTTPLFRPRRAGGLADGLAQRGHFAGLFRGEVVHSYTTITHGSMEGILSTRRQWQSLSRALCGFPSFAV
jgi:hypothetical protein